MIEKRYSLSHAADMLGVDRHTLKRWLLEAGFVWPENARRGKVLVHERDIEAVLRKHSPQKGFVGMVRRAS